MRRPADSLATAVRAFKELTAAGDEAAATRARVLAAADRASRGQATPRRVSLPTVAGLLVICTASVAGTTAAQRWRRPPVSAIDEPSFAGATRVREEHRTLVVIPAVAPAPRVDAKPTGPSDAEAAAYGRAHHAHFGEDAPGRALAAWDDYLRRYPHGTFVPEARFNRALCLVRVGRFADAEGALEPFAKGGVGGGYRSADAERLLAWLRDRPTAP